MGKRYFGGSATIETGFPGWVFYGIMLTQRVIV